MNNETDNGTKILDYKIVPHDNRQNILAPRLVSVDPRPSLPPLSSKTPDHLDDIGELDTRACFHKALEAIFDTQNTRIAISFGGEDAVMVQQIQPGGNAATEFHNFSIQLPDNTPKADILALAKEMRQVFSA